MSAGKGRKRGSNELLVEAQAGEDEALVRARLVLRPTAQAAPTLKTYGTAFGDLDLTALMEALSEQTQATLDGDLHRAEAMLTAQAHTLDAIFHNLAKRAINSDHIRQLDAYLRLSLRAQSQCRATWETLSTIQNPPMVGYVRQANIAHGHQQVNNDAAAPSRAREIEIGQTQLSGGSHELLPDTRASANESQVNSALETLGEIDRAKVQRR